MATGPSKVIPINIGLISLGPVSMLIIFLFQVPCFWPAKATKNCLGPNMCEVFLQILWKSNFFSLIATKNIHFLLKMMTVFFCSLFFSRPKAHGTHKSRGFWQPVIFFGSLVSVTAYSKRRPKIPGDPWIKRFLCAEWAQKKKLCFFLSKNSDNIGGNNTKKQDGLNVLDIFSYHKFKKFWKEIFFLKKENFFNPPQTENKYPKKWTTFFVCWNFYCRVCHFLVTKKTFFLSPKSD